MQLLLLVLVFPVHVDGQICVQIANDEYYYADFGNEMYFAYGTYYDEDLEEWIQDSCGIF